jgi:hypothetical protein
MYVDRISLFCRFSPWFRRHREELAKGSWDNPEWVEKHKFIMSSYIKSMPYATRKEIEELERNKDQIQRQDHTGPNLHKKVQEYMSQPSIPVDSSVPKSN